MLGRSIEVDLQVVCCSNYLGTCSSETLMYKWYNNMDLISSWCIYKLYVHLLDIKSMLLYHLYINASLEQVYLLVYKSICLSNSPNTSSWDVLLCNWYNISYFMLGRSNGVGIQVNMFQ